MLDGGPVKVNGKTVKKFGAAKAVGEKEVGLSAAEDAELILVEVGLS